jgi:L-iditol 2-dehydrogenase
MKAAVLRAKNDIRYEDIDAPIILPNEVLIEVRATGICGSDIPRVLGDAAHYYPIVLGHEFSGIIADVGEQVSNVKKGDRVTAAPLLPCHECIDCQLGHFSQCKHYKFIGSSVFGSWAQYVKVPARNIIKLPDNVSFEEGAFFEPSTVALHGIFNADFRPGFDAAVLGVGTIGQLAVQWLRILGAAHITAFDVDEAKLAKSKDMGADVCINTSEEGFKDEINKIVENRGIDYVFETAGVTFTQKLSLDIVANKGTVCFIGTPTADLNLSPPIFEKILRKELKLTGSWMSYSAPFPGKEWMLTADALARKVLKCETMIHEKFALSDVDDAFDLYRKHIPMSGKVLLVNE